MTDKLLYDSTNAAAIRSTFGSSVSVAGYINGSYAWTQSDWNMFSGLKIQITVTASDNAGDVLDVETGDATPQQTAAWIKARKSKGYYRPTIYCDRVNVPAVRQYTGSYILGIDYDLWVAAPGVQTYIAPGPGSSTAVSVVQSVYDTSYDISYINDAGWPYRVAPSRVVPDFEGINLNGTKVITSQTPAAGTVLTEGSTWWPKGGSPRVDVN